MSAACGRFILRQRGVSLEKEAGISLLGLDEVKKERAVGHLATSEAIDLLYAGVPSLRRKVVVAPTQARLFGRNKGPDKVIALTFSDADTEVLALERREILEVLSSEVGMRSEDLSWPTKRPHLSLARIPGNTPSTIINQSITAVEESLPDTLILQRAIIHNPGR